MVAEFMFQQGTERMEGTKTTAEILDARKLNEIQAHWL
jgi:hypothetical protein